MKTKEELKTLKDLNEEFRKDNIPQKLSGDEFNDYWEEKLKAEAVKWVKEDRGLRKDNKIWRINGDELLDLLEDRWMDRLNLTEDDLK